MKVARIVTLLSDFGLRDPYVGVMKGAIAQVNPHLTIIDLTHDLPPQNLGAARFALMNAYPYFPDRTVHLAVVDPGVGSQRRGVALQVSQGFLVGPDNGLFSGILDQYPIVQAVELTNAQYWRSPHPSATFHGRDIFAPVAAHLASGIPLEALGTPLNPDSLVQLPIPPYTQQDQLVEGTIQYIDHFGNLITTIPGPVVASSEWSVSLANRVIMGRQTYSDCAIAEEIALVGSHGWVEIAVNCGNAQQQLNLSWGDPVQLFLDTH